MEKCSHSRPGWSELALWREKTAPVGDAAEDRQGGEKYSGFSFPPGLQSLSCTLPGSFHIFQLQGNLGNVACGLSPLAMQSRPGNRRGMASEGSQVQFWYNEGEENMGLN